MTEWSDAEIETLKGLWVEHGGGFRKIGTAMGRSRGSIDGKSRTLGLQFHGGRSRVPKKGDDAAVYGTTVFRSKVVAPDDAVLKSGANQRKLGPVVTKGKWKGFPIFSLTLEERATCPRTCRLWLSCYANNMGQAKRYAHGSALESAIWRELTVLQNKHPNGFVVRLHIAGDFYSVAYVDMWADALEAFPALYVFGYTARNKDVIGERVAALRDFAWDRFAVRHSGAHQGPRTRVIKRAAQANGSIICPAQLGKTKQCGTCALCWSEAAMHRPIAFLAH